MRTTVGTIATVTAGLLLGGLVATPAWADVTNACSFDAGTGVITATVNADGLLGQSTTLQPTDLDGIELAYYDGNTVTHIPCTGATVDNTASIQVTGSNADDYFQIMLLGPGTPEETSGVSEIEMDVDLAAGANALFVSTGLSMTAGNGGLNLNNDDDMDVTFHGASLVVFVSGSPGALALSAAGGNGTGSSYSGGAVLLGGPGNDTLVGGSGGDVIIGGGGNDTEYGGAGADFLGDVLNTFGTIDTGHNTLIGGAGPDVFDNPHGYGTVSYASSSAKVTVTLDSTANDGVSGEHDNVMRSIRSVLGGAGNDVIRGDGGTTPVYTFKGGPGNDQLTGGSAGDLLQGGAGADVLKGLAGRDDLRGSTGNDTLYGGDAPDALDGEGGTDVCYGGPAADVFEHCETRR